MAFGKQISREDVGVFGAVCLLNAVVAWLVVGLGGQPSAEAVIRTRIGEALLDGMTVGRQGLICSVWFAPLPTLLLLPFLVVPWDALHAAAPHLVSAVFGAWAAAYVNKILRDFSLGYSRFVITLFLVLNPMVLLHSADGSSLMILVGLLIAALHYLLQWVERNELRDLAFLSLMTALAGITHQMGAYLAVVVVAIVLWDLTRKRLGAHRREGSFLLCIFPVVYVAALWLLFNWLIMGDPLFFVRGTYIGARVAPASGAVVGQMRSDFGGALAQAVVAALRLSPAFTLGLILLAIIAAVRRDFAALTLMLVAAVIPVFHGTTSWLTPVAADAGASADFSLGKHALVGLLPLACLFIGRFLKDAAEWLRDWVLPVESAAAVGMAVLILYNAGWNPSFAAEARQLREAAGDRLRTNNPNPAESLDAALKTHVLARSERARRFSSAKVFVSGFGGFVAFHERRDASQFAVRDDTLFIHTLDFDFQRALADYYQQDLFLLVPRPRGLGAFDSIHYKFPGIYEGRLSPRLFFDSDWGDWRLFEIVKTPAEDQKFPIFRSASVSLANLGESPSRRKRDARATAQKNVAPRQNGEFLRKTDRAQPPCPLSPLTCHLFPSLPP